MIGHSLSTSSRAAPTASAKSLPKEKSTGPGVCLRLREVNEGMDDETLVAEAKRDPTAMADLLVHKRGLVLAVVNRYKRLPQQEEDDLIQLGMIGLVQAARSYDPQKHPSFSTHATLYIRREIGNRSVQPAKRRAAAGVHVVSFQSADTAEDERSLDTRPWLTGGHPEDFDNDDSEDFELDVMVRLREGPLRRKPTKPDARRRIVSADLTPRQREVLLARLDGKLQRELGTQQVVAKTEQAALKKLLST